MSLNPSSPELRDPAFLHNDAMAKASAMAGALNSGQKEILLCLLRIEGLLRTLVENDKRGD